MVLSRGRKIIILFSIILITVIILLVRIRYFKSSQRRGNFGDENLINAVAIAKEASITIGKIIGGIKQKYELFKQVAEQQQQLSVLEGAKGEKLRRELIKKIEEKNIARLDPLIKNMPKELPSEWDIIISTMARGFSPDMSARVSANAPGNCIKNLEFYKKENLENLSDTIISSYNSSTIWGMCEKKIIYEIKNYLILDSCSNEILQCDENFKKELGEYFINK